MTLPAPPIAPPHAVAVDARPGIPSQVAVAVAPAIPEPAGAADELARLLEVVGSVRVDPGPLPDSDLLDLARSLSRAGQALNTAGALVAGEIARRSNTPDGLAQRLGHRTATELVKVTTGSTGRDAAVAVRVGSLDGTPVATALRDGLLSPAAADAIVTGLGTPTAAVPTTVLDTAATTLLSGLADHPTDPDRLLRRARELRDDLDAEGVAEREHLRREQRSLTLFRRPDGMTSLRWLMDPETAAAVTELYDRATSPRRGGVRFTDPARHDQAAAIVDDPRSTEQLASDVFVELLRHGADADASQLLGSGAPQVRVHVRLDDLDNTSDGTETGHALLEGQTLPISAATAQRLACSGGTTAIAFRDGQPLDVGREHRLYTARQRIALAARDGGCRWPGCDRPPSWTEAHHIHQWARDHGRTDIADGILLCRHHHLVLHNHGWNITREGAAYTLHPPASLTERGPEPMPSAHRLSAA